MSTAIKSRRRSQPDDEAEVYLRLAAVWQPRPIRSLKEHEQAFAAIEHLATFDEGTLDEGSQRYLDAVTKFLEDYDDRHPRKPTGRTPTERLGSLVEQAGMTVGDLGKVLGSQPLASFLLAGKRLPSKAAIRKLANHFKVDPSYFL